MRRYLCWLPLLAAAPALADTALRCGTVEQVGAAGSGLSQQVCRYSGSSLQAAYRAYLQHERTASERMSQAEQYNQNIVSVFVNHKTVCRGYAYAAQYLLHELGIACTTVEGTAKGTDHAWNLVVLDGEYYFMDVTWGNSQYESESSETGTREKHILYDYLAATTALMAKSHSASDAIALPNCTATQNSYFVREGLLFEKWDPGALGNRIADAYYAGERQVEVNFAYEDLHDKALSYMVTEGHFNDYCPNLGKLAYIDSAGTNSVLFIF